MGLCTRFHCPDSIKFCFDVFIKAPFNRLKQPLLFWTHSTEEESNGTIAILLVFDLSALRPTLEEALLEAGCYIPRELHTLSLPSFMNNLFQGIATVTVKKGRFIMSCFAFSGPVPFHPLTQFTGYFRF